MFGLFLQRFERIMRATQGALIVASTLQMILGFSGLWRNVVRFLSPISAVPLVGLVGFGLYEFGFPGVSAATETLQLQININEKTVKKCYLLFTFSGCKVHRDWTA